MSKAPRLLTMRQPIREYLRERGEPMSQNLSLQHRDDGMVRMSLMKGAWEEYDEVPDSVTQWYDPTQHVVVIELPEPDRGDDDQLGFEAFVGV